MTERLEVLVSPIWDERAASTTIKNATDLHRRLADMKVDLRDIAKQSSVAIKDISNLSKGAEAFTKSLSRGSQNVFKELGNLGDELEEMSSAAAALKSRLKATKDPGAKKQIETELAGTVKAIATLHSQINDLTGANKKHMKEFKNVIKTQEKFQKSLKEAADYTKSEWVKDLSGALRGKKSIGAVFEKGLKGVGARFIQRRAAAKGGAAGAAGSGAEMQAIASAMQGVSVAMLGISAGLAAFSILVKLLKAASEHQTKLNKALIGGTATANDFYRSQEYGCQEYAECIYRRQLLRK